MNQQQPPAGIRNCSHCNTGHTHSELFCSAYPNGLPLSSKRQGLDYLGALSRYGKANVNEQALIDHDLAACALPEVDPSLDVIIRETLFFPDGLDKLAAQKAAEAKVKIQLESLVGAIENALDPERLKEVEAHLKSKTDEEPVFILYRAKKGELMGVLRDATSKHHMVYSQSAALQKLRDLVIGQTVEPDKFAKLKKAIKNSELPKENEAGKSRAHFTLFIGSDKSAVIRVSDGKGGFEKLIPSKRAALEILKHSIKKDLVPFEEFTPTQKMIEESPLPDDLRPKEEFIDLPYGFTGVVTRLGKHLIDRKVIQGIGLKPSEDGGLTFQGLSPEELQQSGLLSMESAR